MKIHIGRLGRLGFAISMLGSFAILFILILSGAPIWAVGVFVFVNFAWMVLLYIGRIHDIGHSGWWTLLAMLTQGLGLIALAVWPGEKVINAYGEIPPQSPAHLLDFWKA